MSSSNTQGGGAEIIPRLLRAAPLLAIFYCAKVALDQTLDKGAPWFQQSMATGLLNHTTGSVSIRKDFTGYAKIDNFVSLFVLAFTPSLAGLESGSPSTLTEGGQAGSLLTPHRLQMIAFIGDLTSVYAIWLIESFRRGNIMTFVKLPILFGIYFQLKGIGLVAPIYYFTHYIQTPLSRYNVAENRLVNIASIKTLLPALIIGYLLPAIGMYSPYFTLSTRQAINFAWQFFPISIMILQSIFSFVVKDTTEQDKISNVKADLWYLRRTYAFCGLVSTAAYLYVFAVSPVSMLDLFFSGLKDPFANVVSFTDTMARFLKYDELFAAESGGIWILLCFYDLKTSGKLTTNWIVILAAPMIITLLCGPGTAMIAMWAWREEVLANTVVEKKKDE